MKTKCCDKCYTNYTTDDYPAHETVDACSNLNCECHKKDSIQTYKGISEWRNYGLKLGYFDYFEGVCPFCQREEGHKDDCLKTIEAKKILKHDIMSVKYMIEGSVDKQKILNYINAYLL